MAPTTSMVVFLELWEHKNRTLKIGTYYCCVFVEKIEAGREKSEDL
jgi:hypothetical protein